MSQQQIDTLCEPFYVPQYRRLKALIQGDGNSEKYSEFNLAKGMVSWDLRSGEVQFKLEKGRTLRSGKVNRAQPDLLKKLKARYPKLKKLKEILDQVLEELPYYENINDEVGQVGPWNGTWFSDTLIPTQLKKGLDSSATKLEKSIPNSQKDWHYGGDKLVLNLVHPSLYSVNGETTRILEKDYTPTVTNIRDDYKKLLQHKVTGDNAFVPQEEVKELLTSYHKNTDSDANGYYILAIKNYLVNEDNHEDSELFSRDLYLDDDFQWLPSDVYVNDDGVAHFHSYINNLFDAEVAQNVEKVLSKMIPLFERTLTDLRKESRKGLTKNEKKKNDRAQNIPVVKLKGRKIQVIVTMSNIILTPQRPKYPGGRLHVDGMDNEQIVAVGIFYYSCENITESRLALSEKRLERGSFETVPLGSIETKEGRCFVFPNNIQHQVLPFELTDPTRSGHRKRLTFFLVDPSVSILSSARVPPQQKSWWIDQLKEIFDGALPPEIVDHIGSFCISPNYIELKRAREHRDIMAKLRTVPEPSGYSKPTCGD